jgi:hypothetical protein
MTEEVTMKNTKKEMLDLIEELKSEIKNKEKDNLNPEKIKEEAKKTAIIEHSNKAIESSLTTQMHQLKVSINKELTVLSDKLEAEAETYENLKKAIELKESELHEIYGIEKATTELVTILEAQKKARAEFQSAMSEKQACLENELKEKKVLLEYEIKEISEKWEKEKLDRQFIEKETKANLEKERKRENEEYEYQLTRKRQLEENKITDELDELEKAQVLKRDAFEQKYQEKTIMLNEREKNISERELKMQDLQDKVDLFPTELNKAIVLAVQDARERLIAEFTQKEALLLKGFEGESNVLAAKISAYETLIKEQAKQIDKLNLQQDKAYEKIQDIANKAVSGASERLQNITVRTAADKQS